MTEQLILWCDFHVMSNCALKEPQLVLWNQFDSHLDTDLLSNPQLGTGGQTSSASLCFNQNLIFVQKHLVLGLEFALKKSL